MRVLLAFDKFKDSLTAREAGLIVEQALAALHPDWHFDRCPLTDGGEGFADNLTEAAGGRLETFPVAGPRDLRVKAALGLVDGDRLPATVRESLHLAPGARLGIVGLASASGFELLDRARRDPWHTTTLGTGTLLRHAADRGADAILLGLGGSATNDLGLGALTALGLRCLRADGSPVAVPPPSTWGEIARLDGTVTLPPVHIACDVANPLLGPAGATATYGPQKGLVPADLPALEAAMTRMSGLLCEHFRQPLARREIPGTGAAGGTGFGLMVATGAMLVPGFALVSDWLDLPARLAAADLVITGEGRYDATSLTGKGPGGIAAAARRLGKPVHVFAGSLGVPGDVHTHAITPAGLALAEALRRAPDLLAAKVRAVF